MDQHPVPRQITTFEFKLVGFLTIKQFIYLLIFVILAFIVYSVFPIPILNVFFALIIIAIGAALAFLPINDRPLDVWIKNLVKRLISPTQYKFRKHNLPPNFLKDIPAAANPTQAATHVDSQQKLNNYLNKNQGPTDTKKQSISDLIQTTVPDMSKKKTERPQSEPAAPAAPAPPPHKPFFTGLVKNHKEMPIYGVLIYVKPDEKGEPLRILKTNVNGVFATFNPLPPGDYFFEIKDPQGRHFFDTMKVKVENSNPNPLRFLSKELL